MSRRSPDGRVLPRPAPGAPPPWLPPLLLLLAAVSPSLAGERNAPGRPEPGSLRVDFPRVSGSWAGAKERASAGARARSSAAVAPAGRRHARGVCAPANLKSSRPECLADKSVRSGTTRLAEPRLARKAPAKGHLNIFIHI